MRCDDPKIARFLAEQQPATPCLVLDVDRVEANFRALRRALPLARIYYAVKANPAAPVLERLVPPVEQLRRRGHSRRSRPASPPARGPAAISFGNTIKKVSAIRRAHDAGVSLFAFDSAEELEKLARPRAGQPRCIAASWCANAGADWPLSRKFGTTVEMARELMLRAGDLGLDPYGLSFHVGSQQTDTASYELAIGSVAMLFTDLQEAGVNLRMVNLGGGFPVRYRDEVPEIDAFGDAIMGAMTRHFGNALPEMLIEPGRFVVGDAGVVSSEVVLVSRRDRDDPVRWVYLDIGRFGGLAETEGEAIKYRIVDAARRRRDGAGGDRGPDLRRRGHPVRAVELPAAGGAGARRRGAAAERRARMSPHTRASASTASRRSPSTTSEAVPRNEDPLSRTAGEEW